MSCMVSVKHVGMMWFVSWTREVGFGEGFEVGEVGLGEEETVPCFFVKKVKSENSPGFFVKNGSREPSPASSLLLGEKEAENRPHASHASTTSDKPFPHCISSSLFF